MIIFKAIYTFMRTKIQTNTNKLQVKIIAFLLLCAHKWMVIFFTEGFYYFEIHGSVEIFGTKEASLDYEHVT